MNHSAASIHPLIHKILGHIIVGFDLLHQHLSLPMNIILILIHPLVSNLSKIPQ